MKKFNPLKDREDIGKQLLFPVFSPSSMNCWNFRSRDVNEKQAHENWYQSYVLGNRIDPLVEPGQIEAGKTIGQTLAMDPNYLPDVPRSGIPEYTITIEFGNFILKGHMDFWDGPIKELTEIKTSQSETYWNQESVDEDDQITFYHFLLYEKENIRPEEIKAKLVCIPVIENGDFTVTRNKKPIKIFQTSRTMKDLVLFGVEIKRVFKEMENFVKEHE